MEATLLSIERVWIFASRVAAWLLLVLGLGGPLFAAEPPEKPAVPAVNSTTPGSCLVEPPTLHSLGFEWPIKGDDNRNAGVAMRWRKRGAADWRLGLPLLALGHEFADGEVGPKYPVPRMFAGSLMDLEPATEYEVQLALRDPDGGEAVQTVKAVTKAEPKLPEGGAAFHVYPPGSKGMPAGAFAGLEAAYQAAHPGDRILVHAGVYTGSYTWAKSGLPGQPIVIQGAGDGEAVLVNNRARQMFNICRADWLWFENLTFRDPGTGDGGHTIDGVALLAGNYGLEGCTPGCKGLVVRRCTFEDIGVGIMAADAACEGFVITDNRFLGRQDWLGPNDVPEGASYDKHSWTAVWIGGRGHDIGYNLVRGFRDGIDLLRGSDDTTDIGATAAVAIDIYHNDIQETGDDFLETDYTSHNIRVLRNRCVNSAVCGLSAQPVYGGPVYFIRNILFNVTANPTRKGGSQIAFKLEVNPAGVILYHNTSIASQVDPRFWSNCHFRNNLIMGSPSSGAPILHTATHTAHSSLDYDGFTAGAIVWCGPQTGGQWKSFPDLAAFVKATGLETHGRVVDYGIFARPFELPFTPKQRHDPAQVDVRLKAGGAAVDAGERLPNINDGYSGRAPDLGAWELNQPPPHYGPRAQ